MIERALRVVAVAVALLVVAVGASAEVEAIRIDKTEPFADGQTFGNVGPYVRQIGVARGSLDPDDPRNGVIVNLHRAPRNAQGRVEYEADIFLLRPADLAKSNRRVLYEVINRGRKFLMHWVGTLQPRRRAPTTTRSPHRTPATAG